MLDRAHRFQGRTSLGYVYKRGQIVRGKNLAVKVAHNSRRTEFRAAIIVSRKVSKSAVVRNRIRRRLYEIIRELAPGIAPATDIMIITYSVELATEDTAQLRRTVRDIFIRAGILQK